MDIEPIGTVDTLDEDRSQIELDSAHAQGLVGLTPGDRLDVLYWMHELNEMERRRMQVHPRGDESRAKKGVFALRSPMRPNPIGVSSVELLEVRPAGLLVRGLDAQDGSPVIDIKAARREGDVPRLLDMWGKTHHTIMGALEADLGRARLEAVLREPMRQAGRAAAEQALADAQEIGWAIVAIERPWDIEGRVVEDTPNRFRREVSSCPWSFFAPLGCEVFAWWMEGFVKGSNEEYEYSLEKLMPRGDAACAWTVARARALP